MSNLPPERAAMRHLRAVIDTGVAGVEAAIDAYLDALAGLTRAARAWEDRGDWTTFTVAALRAADPALSEPAATNRAATLLALPEPVALAAVAADRPRLSPPGWEPAHDIDAYLPTVLDRLRLDMRTSTSTVDEKLHAEGAALAAFYASVSDAVAAAADAGLPNARISRQAGIPPHTVASMTRPPERLSFADRFRPVRAAAATIGNGDVELLRERLVELGVEERAAEMAGGSLRALGLLWDVHLRHKGRNDPRRELVENQITIMRTTPARFELMPVPTKLTRSRD